MDYNKSNNGEKMEMLPNETQVIMITSSKGGVGKTTIAANLALSLALSGRKTLALDLDFGARCLDLVMGLEDRVVYNILDVAQRGQPPEDALIADPRSDKLFFCAAPPNLGRLSESALNDNEEPYFSVMSNYKEQMDFTQTDGRERSIMRQPRSELTETQFHNALCRLTKGFDCVVIDTPGDTGNSFRLAARESRLALIVATASPTSVRAAAQTASFLQNMHGRHPETLRLIINEFELESVVRGKAPTVTSLIDNVNVQLLGIVPKSEMITLSQMNGTLCDSYKNDNAAIAFENISQRILGKNIPLGKGFRIGLFRRGISQKAF